MDRKAEKAEFAAQNYRVLATCVGPHDFEQVETDQPYAVFRCRLCGGWANRRAVTWYRDGLRAGLREAERRYRQAEAAALAEAAQDGAAP